MALFQKINDDLKSAMKGGQKDRVGVLRFMLAGVQNAQKEKGVKQPGEALTDEEAVAVLQKEAKRRKEAIELFRQGKRDDLVKKEEAELAMIYEYLPKELSAAEIEKMVDELKTQGFNDFNALMRETMKLVKGRTDGKTVGDIIKKKLG
ncbi:MAG: GatB/YqeY domain-containing protein [Minisyncoccia bacterium]|jgi:uncharacterized protein YqeY